MLAVIQSDAEYVHRCDRSQHTNHLVPPVSQDRVIEEVTLEAKDFTSGLQRTMMDRTGGSLIPDDFHN